MSNEDKLRALAEWVERLEAQLGRARRDRDRQLAVVAEERSERDAAELGRVSPSYVHRCVVAARRGRRVSANGRNT